MGSQQRDEEVDDGSDDEADPHHVGGGSSIHRLSLHVDGLTRQQATSEDHERSQRRNDHGQNHHDDADDPQGLLRTCQLCSRHGSSFRPSLESPLTLS